VQSAKVNFVRASNQRTSLRKLLHFSSRCQALPDLGSKTDSISILDAGVRVTLSAVDITIFEIRSDSISILDTKIGIKLW